MMIEMKEEKVKIVMSRSAVLKPPPHVLRAGSGSTGARED